MKRVAFGLFAVLLAVAIHSPAKADIGFSIGFGPGFYGGYGYGVPYAYYPYRRRFIYNPGFYGAFYGYPSLSYYPYYHRRIYAYPRLKKRYVRYNKRFIDYDYPYRGVRRRVFYR